MKQKIEELTNIPIERQKILIKGGKLQDDAIVSSLGLNLSQPIMVLGTPDKAMPSKPAEKQVFLEDLDANSLVKTSPDPSGLVNLGNTCYLNSALQALFLVDEIAKGVTTYKSNGDLSGLPGQTLILSLRNIFNLMQKKHENVNPTLFLTLFRNLFPQFAEQVQGFYKQQDAEEAFSQIMRTLTDSLKIQELFKISFKTESKCIALPDEKTEGNEDANKLDCHITIKTNFLKDGLKDGLKETIEKYNDTLHSNTEYEVTRKITHLPKYLVVHFMRFYWKRDTQKKSKILRKVQFPFELDLADFLDDSIKQEKISNRDIIRKLEKDNSDMVREFKKSKKDTALNPLEQQEEERMKVLSIKTKFFDDLRNSLPSNVDLDSTTENPSSIYDLTAVVSHSGASADSGHYQAFVKDKDDLDGAQWWKFNDNKVSRIGRETIEQLAGGGESDSALLLIYKATGI